MDGVLIDHEDSVGTDEVANIADSAVVGFCGRAFETVCYGVGVREIPPDVPLAGKAQSAMTRFPVQTGVA